jgi:3-hydroxyisobutyrate dehydrogenase
MAVIGFVGLGHMGRSMATRLLSAGHEVAVYDPAAGTADALSTMGAVHASNPRDASEDAEAVFVMVRDDAISRAVWLGDDGVLGANLAPQTLAIECSTLSHGWVMELAEILEARQLRYIDCPIAGTPDTAASGSLVLNVGAKPEDLEAARPLLDNLATEIFPIGLPGTGTAYKLVANLLAAVELAGAAEAFAVARKAGLNMDTVALAIRKDQVASPLVADNIRRMADDHHDRDLTFSVSLRRKDTAYSVAFAKEIGIDPPFASGALAAFEKMEEWGWDELNESKIVDLLHGIDV